MENMILRKQLVLAESRRKEAEAMIEAGEAREKKMENNMRAAIEAIGKLQI
jgi:hypothetical protein